VVEAAAPAQEVAAPAAEAGPAVVVEQPIAEPEAPVLPWLSAAPILSPQPDVPVDTAWAPPRFSGTPAAPSVPPLPATAVSAASVPAAPPAAEEPFPYWSPPQPACDSPWTPGDVGARTTTQDSGPVESWDLSFLAGRVKQPEPEPQTAVLHLRAIVGDRSFVRDVAGEAMIGRRDSDRRFSPDIDLWPDDTVSRRHALIMLRHGRFYLRDMDSTNGTSINGSDIPAGVPVELRAGDSIRLGESAVLEVLPGT